MIADLSVVLNNDGVEFTDYFHWLLARSSESSSLLSTVATC